MSLSHSVLEKETNIAVSLYIFREFHMEPLGLEQAGVFNGPLDPQYLSRQTFLQSQGRAQKREIVI